MLDTHLVRYYVSFKHNMYCKYWYFGSEIILKMIIGHLFIRLLIV